MQDFKPLIELLQNVVDDFNKRIPGIQQQLLDSIRLELTTLELKNGNIVLSAANVRKIADIKSRMQSIVLNSDYIQGVKDYVGAFNTITNLQNQYFNAVVDNFTPPTFANDIKKQAVESVVDNLTERGIGANVIAGIEDILRKNITSGGSYTSLQKVLEDNLTNNDTGDGSLFRYTKQITTDAINQFSGEYTQLISNDLGFEWWRYAGSNLATSRAFCLACTKKKWLHASELPSIIIGDFPEFDEFDGKLYKGLPEGMYPDTTPDNFMVNRGGYNCGHQLRPVSENLVPIEVRNAVYATAAYQSWARRIGKVDKPVK